MHMPPRQKYKIVSIEPRHAITRSVFDIILSRIRDFFKKNRRLKIASAAVMVTIIFAVAVYNSQLCYAVFVNGETVGTVKSISQVTEIVDNVEAKASAILGYDCSLENVVSISAEVGAQASSTDNVGDSLLGSINGISKAYVIHVDGIEIGAVQDCDAFNQLILGYLNTYKTASTATINFKQSVYAESGFVSDKSILTLKELDKILNPAGGGPHSLTVVSTEVTQYASAIAYGTVYCDDCSLYVGDTAVKREGVNGKGIYTTSTVLVNGVADGDAQTSVNVISQPKTEYISVGTAERPKYASYGYFIWPTSGVLTSFFGYRSDDFHTGLDIAGSYGQNVCAADSGEVIFADWSGNYGYLVKIQHDNGDVTYYAHLSSILVSVGDSVAQGDVIAEMGSTGNSTGDHLHFEIRIDGEPVDPLNYLP